MDPFTSADRCSTASRPKRASSLSAVPTRGVAFIGSSAMSFTQSSFCGQSLSSRPQLQGTPLRASEASSTRVLGVTMQKGGTIRFSPSTKETSGGAGTKTTSLAIGTREKDFRSKQFGTPKSPPRILSKVQELRLLSKLESAGLLSKLEKSGLTLAKIEKAGLLTTAEKFGLLSATGNRQTPGLLFTVAFVLFLVGPAAVYLIPDESNALIAAQAAIASFGAFGGAAAFGGASLLSALQK